MRIQLMILVSMGLVAAASALVVRGRVFAGRA
jgi:hypothetical protein